MKEIIVGIEISKKQAYIFKSSKLKENIGASRIIRLITEYLPERYSEEFSGDTIYKGGGNSFFIFKDTGDAKNFISEISLSILENFPEIEFFIGMVSVEESDDKIGKIKEEMDRKKSMRKTSFKKISFGMEEICESSKTPAGIKIKDGKKENGFRIVSEETYLKNLFAFDIKNENSGTFKEDKLREEKELKEIVEKLLGKDQGKKFLEKEIQSEELYMNDLDEFGEKGYSKLAIISLDGNKMGEIVGEISSNTEDIKKFSKEIDRIYKNAFLKVENFVKKEFSEGFPLRKLILAGDDLSYIIDSKLALESVSIFLKSLREEKINGISKLKDKILNACAGIVFVNKKYPFNVAYKLAEELCKDSKVKLNEGSLFAFETVKGELTGKVELKNMGNIYLLIGKAQDIIQEKDEVILYEEFIELVEEFSKEDNETKFKRVGKIKEILSNEFDVKEFNVSINKYRLKDEFTKNFDLKDRGKDGKELSFNKNDYMKALKIMEIYDLKNKGGEKVEI